MKCRICKERETFAEHHFDGEEIDLDNLSKEKRDRYKAIENSGADTIDVCTICHAKIHGNEAEWDPIKALYKLRRDLIEERKAVDNRIRALEEYELDVSDLEDVSTQLQDKVDEISKRLKKLVRKRDIWNWLQHVNGIAEVNAAGLIATIVDPGKFDTISKLWKYSGQTPKNGFDFDSEDCKYENYGHYRQATKENRTLTSYDIGDGFVKNGDFYRDIYDNRREKTESDERFGKPSENKGHYHNDARKVAVKKFLSHLWLVWRKMKGMEVTDPYIIANDSDHNRFMKPPHLDKVEVEV